MARRFFVNNDEIKINDKSISVIGEEVHHINVLRHKVGDKILVNEYIVKIEKIDNNELFGTIEEIEKKDCNDNISIKLYQSYIKSDKMEFVVQKAVELGVNSIIPMLTKNCVVKLENKDKQKKLDRLNKISIEASKQCGRSDIANVEEIIDIKEKDLFISSLKQNDINILAYEKSNNSLKETLESAKKEYSNKKISIGVIIGPEGGFDKTDIEILNKVNNIYEVSLGKRILRAETASLNLLSIINYVFDD